jgi:hypothetical protein
MGILIPLVENFPQFLFWRWIWSVDIFIGSKTCISYIYFIKQVNYIYKQMVYLLYICHLNMFNIVFVFSDYHNKNTIAWVLKQ